jgi:hypothetical protein
MKMGQDIELALGSRKYENRVFSVYVGPTLQAGKDVPWVLLKLPHRQVESAGSFREVVRDITTLVANSGLSHSNA